MFPAAAFRISTALRAAMQADLERNPLRFFRTVYDGAPGRDRTCDRGIRNPLIRNETPVFIGDSHAGYPLIIPESGTNRELLGALGHPAQPAQRDRCGRPIETRTAVR